MVHVPIYNRKHNIKMCLRLESKFNITFENDELETLVNIKIISNAGIHNDVHGSDHCPVSVNIKL